MLYFLQMTKILMYNINKIILKCKQWPYNVCENKMKNNIMKWNEIFEKFTEEKYFIVIIIWIYINNYISINY